VGFRPTVLADSETLSDAQTKEIDLKGLGAISAIEIEVTAINGSVSNKNNHIHHLVENIEVVDGAAKYHQLSGIQEQILDWATFRRIPVVHMDETPSVYQIGEFIIPFGRRIGDRDYFLDVDRLKNPKLNVKFNIAAVRAVGTDAFATNTGAITVKAIVDQEKTALSQKGYFRSTEVYKWTTAASGDEPVELPIDYPYRMLFFRAYKQNSDPLGALSKIKLEFDKPKYEYLFEGSGHMMRRFHLELGLPGWVNKWIYGVNGDTPELPCMRNSAALHNVDGNLRRFISLSNWWKGYIAYTLCDHTGAAIASPETHEIGLYTWMFQNGLILPFGEPLLEDNFFPAPNYKKADLKITQGSATHAASVCLQEVATQ